MQQPNARLCYSVEQAIDVTGLSRKGIYQVINSGELRSYKVGKRRFISHDAIIEFVRQREAASEPMRAAG